MCTIRSAIHSGLSTVFPGYTLTWWQLWTQELYNSELRGLHINTYEITAVNSVREQCNCTHKQCCAVGLYAMCYATAKSCSYWKSQTLCCIADRGNKFYRHLSSQVQIYPRVLILVKLMVVMVMNLYSAFFYWHIHMRFTSKWYMGEIGHQVSNVFMTKCMLFLPVWLQISWSFFETCTSFHVLHIFF